MKRALFAALLLGLSATTVAAADDPRTAIDLPPEVRTQFLEHMRTHMTSLDSVIQLMADGKLKEAGALARSEMAIGQGSGLGRHMPKEFRGMGFEFHRAADDFARITDEMVEPIDAKGWQKLVASLGKITMRCNGCHGAFRVK
uniref:Cytochrome c n=1 Tax=Rhodopseudomonas palustris (strain BisA53) TaxID=316055 RepID=Q07JI4_RHOP5